MKLHLILIFSLLIVSALAHRKRGDDEYKGRRGYRRRCREELNNNNQVDLADEAQESDGEDVEPLPAEADSHGSENVTCKHRRRHKYHRRGGHRNETQGEGENSNSTKHHDHHHHRRGEHKHENLQHNEEWHKAHNIPMPEERNGDDSDLNRHHHHHHRPHHHHRHHHHHHHKNCTTTTSTTTTATPSSLLPEENFDVRAGDKNDVEVINRDP